MKLHVQISDDFCMSLDEAKKCAKIESIKGNKDMYIQLTSNQLEALKEALETYSKGKRPVRVHPEIKAILEKVKLTIDNKGFVY